MPLLTRFATLDRLALSRAGAGAVMLTRPCLLPGLLGVDPATSAAMTWTTQMLGARELALGLGAWAAVRDGEPRSTRLWVLAGMVSDVVDALAIGTAVASGRLSRPAGVAAVAVAAGVAALQAQALARGM